MSRVLWSEQSEYGSVARKIVAIMNRLGLQHLLDTIMCIAGFIFMLLVNLLRDLKTSSFETGLCFCALVRCVLYLCLLLKLVSLLVQEIRVTSHVKIL